MATNKELNTEMDMNQMGMMPRIQDENGEMQEMPSLEPNESQEQEDSESANLEHLESLVASMSPTELRHLQGLIKRALRKNKAPKDAAKEEGIPYPEFSES